VTHVYVHAVTGQVVRHYWTRAYDHRLYNDKRVPRWFIVLAVGFEGKNLALHLQNLVGTLHLQNTVLALHSRNMVGV